MIHIMKNHGINTPLINYVLFDDQEKTQSECNLTAQNAIKLSKMYDMQWIAPIKAQTWFNWSSVSLGMFLPLCYGYTPKY